MRFLVTVLFAAAIAVSAQDAPKQGGGRGQQQPHKNLKILKDDQVRPVMGAMKDALGQKCDFCHVQGDFASDENPKKAIALQMIALVNDVNAKFPDGKVHVSCYTCHRGKNMPDMTPPPAPPAQ
jgi:photosynthetic reaction center cytochrome c subunit